MWIEEGPPNSPQRDSRLGFKMLCRHRLTLVRQREAVSTAISRNTSTKYTPDLALHVVETLKTFVHRSLSARMNVGEKRLKVTIYLSACIRYKLCFHIITPMMIDNASTTGVRIVYELGSSMSHFAVFRLRWDVEYGQGVDNVLLCLLNAHKRGKGSYAVDLVPYARHQLFRIAGNTKGGQRLRLVSVDLPETRERTLEKIGHGMAATASVPFNFRQT